MNSSYPSSTVTDAHKYDSANPPPLSPYSSSTVTDDQKHDSANPPPRSPYSSSTVTDDQIHDSANPPPRSPYSSSTVTDDQKHDSANPPPPSSDQTPPGTEVPWSTDLFSCFDDGPNCCITCCCPCITFGQISEIVDKGATTCGANAAMYALIMYFTACMCCYSCFYRTKMRKQYMLSESPCPDCCVHWFCEPCALCQEYRELKNRGFDMSKGWKGNLERQNHGITIAPVVEKMSK